MNPYYLAGSFVGALIAMFLLTSLVGWFMRDLEPADRAFRASFIAVGIGLVVSFLGAQDFRSWTITGVFYLVAVSLTFLVKRWQYRRAWVDND